MDIRQSITQLVQDGFILVFNQDKLDVVKTAQALAEAGIFNMEVTCRIERPLEKISRLKRQMPEFCVGAASLVDFEPVLCRYNQQHPDDPLPSVDEVVQAGADYLVSAVNFSSETFKRYAGKIAMIPGCGTATEIVAQYTGGANLCKLFPAKQIGGPGYLKAIDPAIHKLISIVPTGGTTGDNIPDYIAAGVLVLGGSFSMIARDTLNKIVSEQDYGLLASEIRQVKALIDDCRAKQYPSLDMKTASLEAISEVTGRNFNID
jgi:2-dehydro-3-deoxyphosphogluconate aldolase/(4S)-4-hydroxy-2-oxoglutarate aldolase